MASLRSTTSAANPRVSLISLDPAPSQSLPESTGFTSLRRTTRSTFRSDNGAQHGGDEFSYASSSTDVYSAQGMLVKREMEIDSPVDAPLPETPKRRKVAQTPTPTTESPARTMETLRTGSSTRRSKRSANIEDVKPEIPITQLKRESESKPNGVGSMSTPKTTPKKALPLLALEKPHPEPVKWREQYRLIEHMRKGIIAPVDDMGCERPRTSKDADPKTIRFHVLISLMLSSQTKDAITSQAVTNLHQTLPGGLTAESLASAEVQVVQDCINKVGFWRRKTEYIQDAARHLLAVEGEMKGDVPNTLEGLCELRGVGPKMAFLCLQCAWDINAGIGVDVHVHRITNRLKWHKPPTQTAEQTRLNLQSWLPPSLHKAINPLMVGFGQVICLPVGPRCDHCLLGQEKICPSRIANVRSEGRKEVVYTYKPETEEERTTGRAGALLTGVTKLEVMYDEDVVKEEIGGTDGPGEVLTVTSITEVKQEIQ